LLEVLDPEQNGAFSDHYLEVDFDLSEVMFVCTANSLNIPAPLLDRMEVIRLPGYTEDEKVNIARRYLVPKQVKQNGLREGELKVADGALIDIVRHYTREAGVRNLEREVAKISRKAVKELLLDKAPAKAPEKGEGRQEGKAGKKAALRSIAVTSRNLDKYLGVRRFRYGKAEDENRVGQVTGLAWTEVGGELLTIEAAVVPGKGKLMHTGQLGEVMQESIQAAMSVVRSRSEVLGLDPDFYQKNDIHLHMPEGATPKDGPSAGVGMCTALVSALTRIPVRSNVAMTGEITLRGEVLPIGGLKEKLLAAQRGGIEIVLIPEENRKDLVEIPDNVKGKLDIRPVRWIDEVLEVALTSRPVPREKVETEVAKPVRRGKGRAVKGVQAH
jgi:ATP-dependent Lon protease